MARLEITHPKFGTWRQASVNPLRLVTNRVLAAKKGWTVDAEGYIANGLAITIWGTNRYTGQPVDSAGRTYEVWAVAKAIMERFPDAPQTNGGAVDRKQRGRSRNLSKHAKSEAIDLIIQKWDGRLGVTVFDRTKGQEAFDWLLAEAKAGRLPLDMILFDGKIAKRSEGWVVRPVNPGTDRHLDHIHMDVRVADRRTTAKPEKEPRRTLRYRPGFPKMKGADVDAVQKLVGIKPGQPYGPLTKAAVERWQKQHGLFVDGVFGPESWEAYDEAVAA